VVHVGELFFSQIGFRDHGPATNGWLWFATLDLKRGRNRNILPHLYVIASPFTDFNDALSERCHSCLSDVDTVAANWVGLRSCMDICIRHCGNALLVPSRYLRGVEQSLRFSGAPAWINLCLWEGDTDQPFTTLCVEPISVVAVESRPKAGIPRQHSTEDDSRCC
jgi:hypothetical protein